MKEGSFGKMRIDDSNLRDQISHMGIKTKILVLDSEAEIEVTSLPDEVTSIMICYPREHYEKTDSLESFIQYARIKNPEVYISEMIYSYPR